MLGEALWLWEWLHTTTIGYRSKVDSSYSLRKAMSDIPAELFGYAALVIGLYTGRILHENSIQQLSDIDKGKYLGAFSKYRKYSFIPFVAIISIALIVPQPAWIGLTLLCYVAIIAIYTFKKLGRLELPSSFVSGFALSQFFPLGGLVIYSATLIVSR